MADGVLEQPRGLGGGLGLEQTCGPGGGLGLGGPGLEQVCGPGAGLEGVWGLIQLSPGLCEASAVADGEQHVNTEARFTAICPTATRCVTVSVSASVRRLHARGFNGRLSPSDTTDTFQVTQARIFYGP